MLEKFTPEQKLELDKPLDSKNMSDRKSGLKKPDGTDKLLYYITTHHAIYEANRIFGFDGWTRETVYCKEVCRYEYNGKIKVGYESKIRVTAGGVTREGTGHGQMVCYDLFDAIEKSAKEAESDATKRALMTFGNQFGLALYDPKQENVVDHEADAKEEEAKKKAEEEKRKAADPLNKPAEERTEAEWLNIANRLGKSFDKMTKIEDYTAFVELEKTTTTLRDMRKYAEIYADQVQDKAVQKRTELLNVKL